MIKSNEYMMLEDYISAGVVNTFRTKKDAQKHAVNMGWGGYNVVRVERRFEVVWIVAQHIVGREQICNLLFDAYSVLTNKIKITNGIQSRITVKVKKFLENAA